MLQAKCDDYQKQVAGTVTVNYCCCCCLSLFDRTLLLIFTDNNNNSNNNNSSSSTTLTNISITPLQQHKQKRRFNVTLGWSGPTSLGVLQKAVTLNLQKAVIAEERLAHIEAVSACRN
jgi:hypothetical protein